MKSQLFFLLILFHFSCIEYINAQAKKQDQLAEQFEKFKSGIQKQHQIFIYKNDSLFLEFLKQSWKKISLIQGEVLNPIKAPFQPAITDTTAHINRGNEVSIDTSGNSAVPEKEIASNTKFMFEDPIEYSSLSYKSGFNFYGIEASFDIQPKVLPFLNSVTSTSISEFYVALIKNMPYWTDQINTLQQLKTRYALNDWGFYQLIAKATGLYYSSSNEQKLLIWFVLLKTGYKVKVGYSNDIIYILLCTHEKIYASPYFKEDGETFYIISEKKVTNVDIQTHDQNYPGNIRLISMIFNSYPLLQGDRIVKSIAYKGQKIEFAFNKGVLDFLSTYPQCDLRVYFGPGLSENNQAIMDGFLLSKLKGLNSKESIDLLLDFCQQAFPYATDQAQFGKERYLFAEESLYFPYNDCEDRTIFLSYLVERYLKLSTIALDFPGHVNLGVATDPSIPGAHVTHNGIRYLICDPTYINAKCGMIDDDYLNKKAKIITYNHFTTK